MAIYNLWSQSDLTPFTFPIPAEAEVYSTWKDRLDDPSPLLPTWSPPLLRRAEPQIHPDIFEFNDDDVWLISARLKDALPDHIYTENLEFLPVETATGTYYVLHLLEYTD